LRTHGIAKLGSRLQSSAASRIARSSTSSHRKGIHSMKLISLPVILPFVAAILLQVIGVSALPLSRGFSNPWWAAVCVLSLGLAMFALARLVSMGAELGILLPLMAATVPLCAVAVGIFAYGETASPLKLLLLVVACGLIGIAGKVA
jgi:multidrug transporter EmrE-like cation transporter